MLELDAVLNSLGWIEELEDNDHCSVELNVRPVIQEQTYQTVLRRLPEVRSWSLYIELSIAILSGPGVSIHMVTGLRYAVLTTR